MNKERELLKRVRDTLLELKETHYNLYWDIQTALDHPSVDLREPLSESEIAAIWGDSDYDVDVVRAIEKAHGIGGGDE